MILRSHKKRPTTHLIKLAWATSSALTLFCSGGVPAAHAQNLISLEFEAVPAETPAVQLIGLEEFENEAPLERLKNRSPEDRWNQIKREALPARRTPVGNSLPAPTPPPLPELKGIQEFQPISPQPAQTPSEPAAPRTQVPADSELPVLPDLDSNLEFQVPSISQSRTAQPPPRVPSDPFSERLPIPRSLEQPVGEFVRTQDSVEPSDPTDPGPALRPLGQILPYYDYESVRKGLETEPDDNRPDIDENRVPIDVAVTEAPSVEMGPRMSPDTVFSWEASNIWYNPLYFEDPTLERYGHVAPPLIQPLMSASRLGVQLFGLPYQMAIDPVRKRRYALGWYRPGDEVPHMFYQVPLNLKAAAVEAGAISAGVGILP